MRFAAFVLAVNNLAHVKSLLTANNIVFEERQGRIFIAPTAGQGTTIIMEEAQ